MRFILPQFGVLFPSASCTAHLAFSNGKQHYKIAGTDNGDGATHLFYRSGADTKNWMPGHYKYVISVTDGTDRYTLETGDLEIKPNPIDGAFDALSQTKRILDQLNDRIEGSSLRDDQSYSIAGRSISRMSINELIEAQKVYAARYAAERRRQRKREGKSQGYLVKVRMR